MATDTLLLLVRAQTVRTFLIVIGEDCPSRRETEIQIAKLERMVVEFHDRFTAGDMDISALLPSGSGRKKFGAAQHALNQQVKTVRRLFLRSMEEDFFRRYPEKVNRKASRVLLRVMNGLLEQKLYEVTQDMKKRISAGQRASEALLASAQFVFGETPSLAA